MWPRVRRCEDVALPLMRDERWEQDTLFLVFEEDFRFTNDDVEPCFVKGCNLQEVVGEAPSGQHVSQVPLDADNKES